MADPAAVHQPAAYADMHAAEPHAEEQLMNTHTGAPVAAGHQAAQQLGGPPALHRGGMGGTGSEWIACDECGKWRQAAVGDVARGPWTCSINQDPRCHRDQSSAQGNT
jgi:CW-type Zinc Finger